MPSSFPGMDPFIEMQDWESFHASFIVDISDALSPVLQPKYLARPQRRVYVEHTYEAEEGVIIADSAVLRPSGEASSPVASQSATQALPMPEPRYETFLTVRDRETMEVVTILELLSPANKRAGDGRREYLTKREEVLQSRTHLVELDLLRRGQRLPTVTPLPPADYYALISRAGRRPRAQVCAWSLRQPLPTIPIPLRGEDPDVLLELQPLFTERYDRGAYAASLDYSQPISPPLDESDSAWLEELLRAK